MDVWIGVLGFVLFFAFLVAVMVCITAIKKKPEIMIKSRLHHKVNSREVIYANLGLIGLVVLVYLQLYTFVPGILAFVLFIVLSTQIQSGLTKDGAIVGTAFVPWSNIKTYKLVNDEADSNIIILKIRVNQKQYVMVCDREDRFAIAELFQRNRVKQMETIH